MIKTALILNIFFIASILALPATTEDCSQWKEGDEAYKQCMTWEPDCMGQKGLGCFWRGNKQNPTKIVMFMHGNWSPMVDTKTSIRAQLSYNDIEDPNVLLIQPMGRLGTEFGKQGDNKDDRAYRVWCTAWDLNEFLVDQKFLGQLARESAKLVGWENMVIGGYSCGGLAAIELVFGELNDNEYPAALVSVSSYFSLWVSPIVRAMYENTSQNKPLTDRVPCYKDYGDKMKIYSYHGVNDKISDYASTISIIDTLQKISGMTSQELTELKTPGDHAVFVNANDHKIIANGINNILKSLPGKKSETPLPSIASSTSKDKQLQKCLKQVGIYMEVEPAKKGGLQFSFQLSTQLIFILALVLQ